MISFVKFFSKDILPNKGIPASGDIIIVISEQGGSIDSAGRISGDANEDDENALLKLQEKNLLKYVMFIL